MAHATDQTTSLDEDEEPSNLALAPAQCAVARCAEVVSSKWTLLVVRDLLTGPKSYSDLESSLAGISPRTLCERLKLLVSEGLATRTRIKGLPPRTVYELTGRGHGLAPIVEAMRIVGDELLLHEPDAAAAAGVGADECCG